MTKKQKRAARVRRVKAWAAFDTDGKLFGAYPRKYHADGVAGSNIRPCTITFTEPRRK